MCTIAIDAIFFVVVNLWAQSTILIIYSAKNNNKKKKYIIWTWRKVIYAHDKATRQRYRILSKFNRSHQHHWSRLINFLVFSPVQLLMVWQFVCMSNNFHDFFFLQSPRHSCFLLKNSYALLILYANFILCRSILGLGGFFCLLEDGDYSFY